MVVFAGCMSVCWFCYAWLICKIKPQYSLMTLPTLPRPILDYFPFCLRQFSLFSFGQTHSHFAYSEKAILHAILVCILNVTGFKAFKFCSYAVNDYHNRIVGISTNFLPQSIERIFFGSWQNGIFIGRKEMGIGKMGSSKMGQILLTGYPRISQMWPYRPYSRGRAADRGGYKQG